MWTYGAIRQAIEPQSLCSAKGSESRCPEHECALHFGLRRWGQQMYVWVMYTRKGHVETVITQVVDEASRQNLP